MADIERRVFGGGLMVADFRRWAFVGGLSAVNFWWRVLKSGFGGWLWVAGFGGGLLALNFWRWDMASGLWRVFGGDLSVAGFGSVFLRSQFDCCVFVAGFRVNLERPTLAAGFRRKLFCVGLSVADFW